MYLFWHVFSKYHHFCSRKYAKKKNSHSPKFPAIKTAIDRDSLTEACCTRGLVRKSFSSDASYAFSMWASQRTLTRPPSCNKPA